MLIMRVAHGLTDASEELLPMDAFSSACAVAGAAATASGATTDTCTERH